MKFLDLLSLNKNAAQIRLNNERLRDVIEKIENNNRIYLWPSGRIGKLFRSAFLNSGYNNITMVDSGYIVNEIEIRTENKVEFTEEDVLIICSTPFMFDIYNEAFEMNCKNISAYFEFMDFFDEKILSLFDYPNIRYADDITNHLLKNQEEYKEMYNLMEDELSKKHFLNNMFFRLTHDIRYMFDMDDSIQYFELDLFNFNENSVLVDVGGYSGDTLEEFLNLKIPFSKYYLFEPDSDLINLAKEVSEDSRIILIEKGLYSSNQTLLFSKTNDFGGSICDNGDISIEVVALDEVLIDCEVNFIKMDIEGAELDALKGAENIIKKYSPVLAICVYHKPEDYLEILNYIRSINSGYKYYLRHYFNGQTETVLYAIKK